MCKSQEVQIVDVQLLGVALPGSRSLWVQSMQGPAHTKNRNLMK